MAAPTAKAREVLYLELEPDLARLVRLHRAETREPAVSLVTRLLRAELTKKPKSPRPTKPAA